jgi:Protein of unknown function (DUF1761)
MGVNMRIFGLKSLPVLIATITVYAVGVVIYAILFDQQWMAMAGYTEDSFKGQEWRMALSPIMPLLIVLGIGFLMKGRDITNVAAGLKLGGTIGVFFLVAARMYSYAYGIEPAGLFALDAAHLLLNGTIAGAILGAMKAAD